LIASKHCPGIIGMKHGFKEFYDTLKGSIVII